MSLDLKHLYQILDYSYQQREHPPGESVCLVICPPRGVSEQFSNAGKVGEDTSPAHCTVAYLGQMPLELEDKVVSVAESVAAQTKPFNVRIGKMGIFENDDNDVYHMKVHGKKLHDFRGNMKHAFNMSQIPIDTKYPDFKPHITMEYAEKGKDPQHLSSQLPEGKWMVENAWLWGLSQPYMLQFK